MPNLRDKFRPNSEGLYLVKIVLLKRAVKLMDLEGNEFSKQINMDVSKDTTIKREKKK